MSTSTSSTEGDSQARLHAAVFDCDEQPIVVATTAGDVLVANESARRQLGGVSDETGSPRRAWLLDVLEVAARGQGELSQTFEIRDPRGQVRSWRCKASVVRPPKEGGRPSVVLRFALHVSESEVFGLLSRRLGDVNERLLKEQRIKEQLEESRGRIDLILRTIPLGIAEYDDDGIIHYVNPAFRNLVEMSQEEIQGTELIKLVPEEERNAFERRLVLVRNAGHAEEPLVTRLRQSGGGILDVSITMAISRRMREGRPFFVATVRDVTEELANKHKLERLANVDTLTGAHNRRYLTDAIERECSRMRRHGGSSALLLIDIDRFKRINDRHGHEVGDMVLVRLLDVLRANTRRTDVVARIGGEEFVVFMPQTPLATAVIAAERLRSACEAEKMMVGDERLAITFSGGLVPVDGGNDALKDIMSRADELLYAAKQRGRNRVICAEDVAPPRTSPDED